jgi:ATP-binding cassette subfamily B protein
VAGVIVLIGGGLAVLHGSISTGDLIAFMAILALARGQLNWVVAALPDVLNGLAAIERIDEVLARKETEPYRGKRPIELRGQLSWEGVTFGYSREEPPVLEDVSLTVEAGEAVAILGPTGAGKTTLIALLLGLYRPWSGAIRVDGSPLEEIDVRGLRRQAGALLQEGAAMRGTVAENIAFGRPDAPRGEVERAAELAALSEFVDELPSGYETEIGDEGVRLSAGQRQRIALARALLGSPPLLMLDEPTSHLDPATADLVLDNLMGIEPRPTLLLVTHDPLVAERADRLVEVRGGKVGAAAASVLGGGG